MTLVVKYNPANDRMDIVVTDVPLRGLEGVVEEYNPAKEDRVIFRDETGLWHELVLKAGELEGVRLIGALSERDAVAALDTNQSGHVNKWPLMSWTEYLKGKR